MTLSVRDLMPATMPERVILRMEDAVECAELGLSAQLAVAQSAEGSVQAWMLMEDEEVLVYGGYAPRSIISTICDVWMLAGPRAHLHPVAVARLARKMMLHLLVRYTILSVVVDQEHLSARSWLHFLGFRPYVPIGLRFMEYRAVKGHLPWEC